MRDMSEPLTAVTAPGTFSIRSARFSAVTTTSDTPAAESGAGARAWLSASPGVMLNARTSRLAPAVRAPRGSLRGWLPISFIESPMNLNSVSIC